jgi:hypothetical protein
MNLVFGLGSFTVQKDIAGGSIIAALEAGGLTCAIIGIVNLAEANNLPFPGHASKEIYESGYYRNYYVYTFNGNEYSSPDEADNARQQLMTKKEVTGGILLGAGVALYAAGAIYGFIRPSSYHRPGYVARAPLDALNLSLVSDRRGDPGLRLSYKLSF